MDYRVRSSILAEASPVFEDMFDIAKASPEGGSLRKAGTPVVVITETSEVMKILLRMCYPVPAPELRTMAQVRGVLAALDKYLMESLLDGVKRQLTNFKLPGGHPLLVYITAHRYGYEDIALIAARQAILTFDKVQAPLQDECIPELDELSAGAYYRLLEYFRTGDARARPATPLLSSGLVHPEVRPKLTPYSSAEWRTHSALPYPFSTPSADLTLRTCDGVEFMVHSDLLRIASPYFKSLLSGSSQQARSTVREVNNTGC